MELKLTSGDGSVLILKGNNPVEFILDISLQTGEVEGLAEISDELWEAYKYVTEAECQLNIVKEDIIYSHQNPMNPDENFILQLI